MLYVISVCMEDLRGYEILRKRLMRGEFNLELASTIARNLAVVHRETHRTKIGTEALAEMDKTFEYKQLLIPQLYFYKSHFTLIILWLLRQQRHR